MSSPAASVVIVTWNGGDLLRSCLEGLKRQEDVSFQIVVVDNGSSDGTIELLHDHHPDVRTVANRVNRGFAAANNQGFAASDGEFIATLNNDAVPDRRWLTSLVALAREEPRTGSVASRMVQASNPALFDSAGLAPDRLGYAWNLRAGMPVPALDPAREVFGACAGAALYRREAIVRSGGFDERFESYYEDVDLAWRLRHRGWESWYQPAASVTHMHSATGKRIGGRKAYLVGRNRIWTMVKNAPRQALWPGLAFLPADFALAAVRAARGEHSGLAGRVDALANLAPVLAQRAIIQNERRAVWESLEPLLTSNGF